MRSPQRFYVAALALVVLPALLLSATANRSHAASLATTQSQASDALQRGYRTGYSDGYQAGWRDIVEGRARDYRGKEDYRRADRVYVAAYGSLDDYRDGYRQGFENGYTTGYDKRSFDSTVPDDLRRRDAADTGGIQTDTSANGDTNPPASDPRTNDDAARNRDDATRDTDDDDNRSSTTTGARRSGASGASGTMPADTSLRVELLNRLSSDISMRGDRFEARVLEPREFEGAIVSGRVTRVRRAPKVRGTAELQLDFDQIRFVNGGYQDFSAQVVEVIPLGGDDDNAGEVDPEGGVRGRSTTKDDVAKVGATTGVGAIIGAIAGGGKGAAIGAAIGGAVGTGGVLTQRGKDIRFERGQQLRIRTTRDTQVR